MGDAENFQPSKKRAAGVQLSRDNPGLDDEEETPEGTFKKASEDVLATRRIVKVRRLPASTPAAPPPSASNPFAAIRLVTPTSTTPSLVESLSDQSKYVEQIDNGKSDNNVGESEKTVNDDNTKQPENKVDDSKAQPKDENDIFVNKDKEKSVIEEIAGSVNSEDGATKSTEADTSDMQAGKAVKDDGYDDKENENGVKKSTEADTSETQAGKAVKDDGDDKEKENEDGATKSTEADTGETQAGKAVKDDGDDKEKENGETAEKNDEAVPFGSFRQLSSSQNAFSGLTGTGFSSTSFSFGSLTKDSTSLNSDSSTFSFGVSNNGTSSIFGSSGASTVSKSEGSKFPPMQEVPLETGEENESAVFTADSVVFEYIDGAWKERGKGELKLNVSTTGTGKARLVMRARGNYRLILNASLFPDMKLTNMDKKGITFACVNSAGEGKDGLSTIALKFKDPSIVAQFRAAVTNHKSTAPGARRTPENSPGEEE